MRGRGVLVVAAGVAGACGPHDRDLAYYEREPEPDATPTALESSGIDADQQVASASPGESVAAVVEYEKGGTWSLGVTCDTELSGYACQWDIIVRTLDDAPIFRVLGNDLESSDRVLVDLAAARLLTFTTDDLDGLSFRAGEGGSLRVDVFLDGSPRPELVRWMGDGALHLGAPTNPFDLVPDSP